MTNMTGNLSDSNKVYSRTTKSHLPVGRMNIKLQSLNVPVIGMIINVTKNLLIAKDLIIPQDVWKFLKTLIKSFQIC